MDKRKFLLIFDGVVIYTAFLLGYYFRFYTGFFSDRGVPSILFYLNITLFAIAAYLMIMASLGTYREKLFPNFVRETASIIEGTFWTAVVLTAGTFFYRGFLYSRLAVGFSLLFAFMLMWLLHYIFVKIERAAKKKILIIGSGTQVGSLVKRLKMHSAGRIVPEMLPEFNEKAAEKKLFADAKRTLVIASPKDYSENLRLVSFADAKKLQLYLIPGIYQFLHSGEIDDIDGLPFLAAGRIPLEKFPGRVLKKMLSTTAGALLFLIFCAVLPLFCLIIKLDSKGPVFFRQERLGFNGRVFRIFKFRTMKIPFTHEAPFTCREDARVTRAGRFLRKYNLDELPQLFNVLNGEMAIVGPRPISTKDDFFIKYDYFRFRLRVKPGLTGWAQIHGLRGGHIEPEERLQYDLYYIENWSIWLDLAIMLLSPGALRNAF